MGVMRWRVPIGLPEGLAKMTPELSLSYSSGSGSSIVGMGWSLRFPFIERTTFRGLPRYTPDDGFSADGDQELVHLGSKVYRARFEKSFVRYTWLDAAGTGVGGY
jgi:hypothetical protein